tara:strand:+ start:587 stop:823 length:237 start_codon:yes stop_codon:yes gene_type:complete
MYGRKKKDKPVLIMKSEKCSTCGDTQHKVPQTVVEQKKIKPTEVFGSGYNKPQTTKPKSSPSKKPKSKEPKSKKSKKS